MGNYADIKIDGEEFQVEYEVLSSLELLGCNDEERFQIASKIDLLEEKSNEIDNKIQELNKDIYRLTNHADRLDYIVAVGSGILSGVIDVLFVDDFSLENAHEWGSEKTNNFVVKIARWQGYSGNDTEGAIKYLADNKKHKDGSKGFHIPADSNTNDFGGGLQHHLRDFAHHPTLVGLTFSILTQFTEKSYGTDTAGNFIIVEVKNKTFIGEDIPRKLLYGVIYWFFHMVSDVAGSGKLLSEGTGLPGPMLSLLKEISALPFFKKLDSKGYKELSVWISKLFNGTLLAKHDENGNIIKGSKLKFDFRTELGILNELKKQAFPVLVNECVVRGFYFLRRLMNEIRDKKITGIKQLSEIDWQNTLPIKNRTVIRMLTISTGTMTAIDIADAAIESAIKSGGINPVFVKNMVVKVNFVGIGRFAVAVACDTSMGVKKRKKQREQILLLNEQLYLQKNIIYYKQADMWISAQNAEKALNELYNTSDKVVKEYIESYYEMLRDIKSIDSSLPLATSKNSGLADEISNILKWGE